MPRVKRSVNAKKKRREVLEQASGYWGLKSKTYRRAKEQVMRSGNYAFRDRKARKRDFRKLWIIRINAGARQHGISYSQLMHGLKLADIQVDRKILADLAVAEPKAFAVIVEKSQGRASRRRRRARPTPRDPLELESEAANGPAACKGGGPVRFWACSRPRARTCWTRRIAAGIAPFEVLAGARRARCPSTRLLVEPDAAGRGRHARPSGARRWPFFRTADLPARGRSAT